MSRAFVTGGSGLIGGALVDALVGRGDEVVALARSDDAARALAARVARVARADLLDEGALAEAMRGSELAFHVAGVNTLCTTDPAELLAVNVAGARAVARAAARAGVGRLVHTSSAAVLGEPAGAVGHEDSPHRGWYLSPYERSKHEGERAVLAVAEEAEGLDVVCVNPASVQGPGRAGGTARLLLAAIDGRLPVVVDTRLSVVDLADCVEGHLLAARHGAPGRRYALCGATLTTGEALALLREVTGATARPRTVPPAVLVALGAAV
ncbi:MAG: NAD-dependent epimerase/dehydratase family protein, partial [Actinomycetota bacterium]|nr:NAD-dependent epimerase/dehydratase family protein [Actinomycetota bacterium]